MYRVRFAFELGWRIAVMALCAAAIACVGWYVAYDRLFELAFATRLGWLIGFLSLLGFASWVFLAADVFLRLQDQLRQVMTAQEVARFVKVRMAEKKRLELLVQSYPTPRNAKTILTRLRRVK